MKPTNGITNNFNFSEQKDLGKALAPAPVNRVLAKDIERQESLPKRIGSGSKPLPNVEKHRFASGSANLGVYGTGETTMLTALAKFKDRSSNNQVVYLPYRADSAANSYVVRIPINEKDIPITMVWSLGEVYDGGGQWGGSGMLPGNLVVAAPDIEVPATGVAIGGFNSLSAYTVSKTEIIIGIEGVNAGYTNDILHLFYVTSFYDELDIGRFFVDL